MDDGDREFARADRGVKGLIGLALIGSGVVVVWVVWVVWLVARAFRGAWR